MAFIAAAQAGLNVASAISKTLFGAKEHDTAKDIDSGKPLAGVSDDVSWPITHRFVQAKELDGGTSWSADNKLTWIWLRFNPVQYFSIEDKSPSNMQAFVNKLQSLYAAGKIPANYDVATNYKVHVVDGRDLTFSFLDEQVKTQSANSDAKSVLASLGVGDSNSMYWLIGGGVLLLASLLLKKGK